MIIPIFTVLIILASIALGFFILVQNPKGGGLTGSFGTLGSQVMGVKQSNDAMEKGTWTAMGIIVALCIVAVSFYPKVKRVNSAPAPAPTQQSAPTPAGAGPAAPAGGVPAPAPAQ